MAKTDNAINLFLNKMPDVDFDSVEQARKNVYLITSVEGNQYEVDLSNNSVCQIK